MRNKSIAKLDNRKSLNHITTYQAGVRQASAHRILQKYCDTVLRSYDITKMQWLIIGTVMDAGEKGVRITELAQTLSTTLSYLTTTINLLESKGMLTRSTHSEDSRSKMVAINPDYVSTAQEIEEYLRQKLRETIYAQVSPADFRIYMKVMTQLSNVKS